MWHRRIFRLRTFTLAKASRRAQANLKSQCDAGWLRVTYGSGGPLAGDLAAQRDTLHVSGTSLADQVQSYRQQVFWADPRSDARDQHTAQAYWDCLPARFSGFDRALLLELVEQLGLVPHQQKAMYMLSTGTKRKVWLVAALASGARLSLLDEPFAALDRASIDCWYMAVGMTAGHCAATSYQGKPSNPLCNAMQTLPPVFWVR